MKKNPPEPMNVIYGLFHKDSPDKILYVGQTHCGMTKRFGQHVSSTRIAPVAQWIRDSGRENIGYLILENVGKRDALNDSEIRWVEEMGTYFPSGLNMTLGGRLNLGRVVHEADRERARLQMTGNVPTEQARLKISRAGLGRVATPEAIEKMRLASREQFDTEEYRQKKMAAYLGLNTTGTFTQKTHCLRGHKFTYDNTGYLKLGRYCVTCNAARSLARRAKRKAAGLVQD